MINGVTWHFNMPSKVKEILDILIEKAETKTCVDADSVIELRNKISWTNLPKVVDDALELLGAVNRGTEGVVVRWKTLPSKVEALQYQVENLDCRSVTTDTTEVDPQNISNIRLVEYDAEEDLTGDNEPVNITVYFEDKSGDEVPNVGKKLFLDKDMLKPLLDYKGAFYFIRPSKLDEKVTMLVRSTGTVKKTRFEV